MSSIKKINARGVDYNIEAQSITGVTATVSELNNVAGSTGNIQTQLTTNAENITAVSGRVTTIEGKEANWDAAYTHSTSAHARTDATKVEASDVNGDIKINGTDTVVYTHPSHSASASGLYKITVDALGHVSAAAAVAKADITALGIPGEDTNTTYTISGGTNAITLTPSSGSAQSADITSKNWGDYTFTTAGWTDDTATSGFYIQTLSITDMTANDYPTLIPTYASASGVTDMQTALGKVAYITTAAGSITAYATEALTTAITFKLVGR